MNGDLEENDEDENSEEQEFDSFGDSDMFKQDKTSSNKFEQDHRKSPTDTQQYLPPLPADTSWTSPSSPSKTWTSPSSSSNDSGIGIPACDPLLSTLTTPTQTNSSSIKFEPVNSSSIKFEQVQTSPVSSTDTTQQNLQHNQLQLLQNKVANSLNNNNDDIFKNEFADFVDLVDSLQGMPDIDFEDNFEMFPIH